MMSPANEVVSILLVALQFALIGALLWPSGAWQFSWPAVLLIIAGVALGLALVTRSFSQQDPKKLHHNIPMSCLWFSACCERNRAICALTPTILE